MAFITYPIPAGTKLYTIAITGGNLAASALTLADGTNVDSAHPLPVTAAVTSLPAITFAAPQHTIVDSLPSVTIANPTDVSALATATLQGTGNTSLASILTKLGDVLTALQGTLTTAGTSTVSGTVAATQGGAWSTGITGTLPAFANPPAVAQSGSWAVSVSSLPSVTIGAALPASANVIGHVIADSGSTTAVTSLPALPAGSNAIGSVTVANPTDVSALATSTKQDTGNTSLASLVTANHVDLAAILAKIVAAPALDATLTNGAQVTKINDGNGNPAGPVGGWVPSGPVAIGTSGVVLKASAGVFSAVTAYNSAGTNYLQVHNAATTGAIQTSTLVRVAPSTTGAANTGTITASSGGIKCSAGIAIAWSSTQYTYTAVAVSSGTVLAEFE